MHENHVSRAMVYYHNKLVQKVKSQALLVTVAGTVLIAGASAGGQWALTSPNGTVEIEFDDRSSMAKHLLKEHWNETVAALCAS